MMSSPREESKLNPSFIPSPNSSTCSNAPITTTTTRSESNNPSPTTFVQADTTSFKQVVQMLTGSSQTINKQTHPSTNSKFPDVGSSRNPIPAARNKTGFKLFERRNSMKNGFKISPLSSGLVGNGACSNLFKHSPRKSEILSPSMLDFPSLVLSPVTPLFTDPFFKKPVGSGLSVGLDVRAEERAIAEKGFYLHSSPRHLEEPKLLPLFPVTSPKCSGSDSSS